MSVKALFSRAFVYYAQKTWIKKTDEKDYIVDVDKMQR